MKRFQKFSSYEFFIRKLLKHTVHKNEEVNQERETRFRNEVLE